MRFISIGHTPRSCLVLFVALCAVVSARAEAQAAPSAPGRLVTVPVKGARVVRLAASPAQISLSDSEVVDVKLLAPRRLLITAKRLGGARIVLIDRNGAVRHYEVNVVIPVEGLTERFQRIMPRQAISAESVGNTVVLTGTVDSPLHADRAARMAGAHLKAAGQDAKVLNFLNVRGRQQVQLRVKVAEVSRTGLRQIGMNAWYRAQQRAVGLTAPGTQLNESLAPDLGTTGSSLQPGGGGVPPAGALGPVPMLTAPFGESFGLLFSSQDSSSFPISIAISLLQQKGLAKVISEPTVIAYSGQEASFLAGGEFPIPVPQGLGQTSIEFKKFGVQLQFTPNILGDGNVRMKVAVTVSERDQSGAVSIQQQNIPALATRHSETTVNLKNGQSFAIAGLLQDRIESTSEKVPLLGEIPIVGALFRRSSFRRSEQELVVLVTAHLVQPLDPGEIPSLPGEDELSDPGNIQFFLLGLTDAGVEAEKGRGPAGPVGFSK